VDLANISETVMPFKTLSDRYKTRYLFMRLV
jgi:hypothetical protein